MAGGCNVLRPNSVFRQCTQTDDTLDYSYPQPDRIRSTVVVQPFSVFAFGKNSLAPRKTIILFCSTPRRDRGLSSDDGRYETMFVMYNEYPPVQQRKHYVLHTTTDRTFVIFSGVKKKNTLEIVATIKTIIIFFPIKAKNRVFKLYFKKRPISHVVISKPQAFTLSRFGCRKQFFR